jgi:vacuolar-type H+-ATPase subunit I/STV1
MEKMYSAVQKKLKQLTTQEPNLFYEKKNKLHEQYMKQLDKVIREYPNYKAEATNDYTKQLSLLNGITKKMSKMESELQDKIILFERNVNMGNDEIQKLKTVEYNLSDYSSFDELDITSKKMLSDSIDQYNQKRVLLWIKLGVILLILMDSVKFREFKQLGIVVLATLILSIIILLYRYYNSKG